MKILNLYAGIGGNRKLWGDDHDITAVEYDQATADVYKSYFPNDNVIVTDAHYFLLDNYKEFDFIWSSPPCPTHSTLVFSNEKRLYNNGNMKYPDMKLYQEIILLKSFCPKNVKYCIENVIPYYDPLIPPTKKLHRHFYWANFPIGNYKVTDNRKHKDIEGNSEVYGFSVKGSLIRNKRKALRNMVDPELGKYILDCAQNIIRKQNVKQGDLFINSTL